MIISRVNLAILGRNKPGKTKYIYLSELPHDGTDLRSGELGAELPQDAHQLVAVKSNLASDSAGVRLGEESPDLLRRLDGLQYEGRLWDSTFLSSTS